MTATTPGIEFSQAAGVVSVLLGSEGGNLMSTDMCAALTDVLLRPPQDAHVLVIRAAGDHFCLGRERTAVTVDTVTDEIARLIELNSAFGASRLVTVAEVHGNAAGYGVGLAALADVAIASENARFSFPEVGLGLAPAIVLAWLQPLVGRRDSFWLTATGEEFSAREALRLGILNEVADDREHLARLVSGRVDTLLAASPRVHQEIKSFLSATATMTEAQAYEVASGRLAVGSLRRALAQG